MDEFDKGVLVAYAATAIVASFVHITTIGTIIGTVFYIAGTLLYKEFKNAKS